MWQNVTAVWHDISSLDEQFDALRANVEFKYCLNNNNNKNYSLYPLPPISAVCLQRPNLKLRLTTLKSEEEVFFQERTFCFRDGVSTMLQLIVVSAQTSRISFLCRKRNGRGRNRWRLHTGLVRIQNQKCKHGGGRDPRQTCLRHAYVNTVYMHVGVISFVYTIFIYAFCFFLIKIV